MSVIINFFDKNQADEFIKEYADKKIDGKNTLQFQFRKGMIIRKNQENDDESKGDNIDKENDLGKVGK